MNEHKGTRKQHVSIWLQEMEVPAVAKGSAEGETSKKMNRSTPKF